MWAPPTSRTAISVSATSPPERIVVVSAHTRNATNGTRTTAAIAIARTCARRRPGRRRPRADAGADAGAPTACATGSAIPASLRLPARHEDVRCGSLPPMRSLDGKVAIVTGASRGIGRAIAQRFAAEGAAVAVVARTLEPGDSHLDGSLRETVAAITAAGARGLAITADLADPEFDAPALVARVEAELGPVDVLVHNAAACFYLPWDAVSARRYDVMFARQRGRDLEAHDRGPARHAHPRPRVDREPLDDGRRAPGRSAVQRVPRRARRDAVRGEQGRPRADEHRARGRGPPRRHRGERGRAGRGGGHARRGRDGADARRRHARRTGRADGRGGARARDR